MQSVYPGFEFRSKMRLSLEQVRTGCDSVTRQLWDVTVRPPLSRSISPRNVSEDLKKSVALLPNRQKQSCSLHLIADPCSAAESCRACRNQRQNVFQPLHYSTQHH